MHTVAEYIWLDGTLPTAQLRSKTKVLKNSNNWYILSNLPDWGFDGSSTNQASGHDSDCVLKPVRVVIDPFRDNGILVMCEVFMPDGITPHPTNTRAKLRDVLDAGAGKEDPWFGIEQEYTLFNTNGTSYGPTSCVEQGPFYCGVGAGIIFGRELYEEHLAACLEAELLIEGGNWEVAPGQAECQIGAGDPLLVGDHLWLARWLLHRIGERHNIIVSFGAKPLGEDFNGAGCHCNFSTAAMRSKGTDESGMAAINAACEKFALRVPEHIAVYGAENDKRLTGLHETCDINTFRYGVADRGASIRIPRHVATQGYGYLEDRRPAANADPYEVCAAILKTTCDLW